MDVLVTGANGMLGQDLTAEFRSRGFGVVATDVADLDISDPTSVAKIPAGDLGRFDWVVNCAAYTAVDRAETEERLAYEINALGVGYLAQAAAMAQARFLHLSTDFVFDGTKAGAYVEEDLPRPLGAYGRTKLAGEEAALAGNPGAVVVRTSWLFGPLGPSFPRAILKAHAAGKPLRVVSDQRGNPTYTADLARTLADLMAMEPPPGVYHATGPETMSWHDLATLTIRSCVGEKPQIEAIATVDWPTLARRPANSALSNSKLAALGVGPMRPVTVALSDFCLRLATL